MQQVFMSSTSSTVGSTQYDTDRGRQHVQEMISRDVNHRALSIWDNGK